MNGPAAELGFRDRPLPADEGSVRSIVSATGFFRPDEVEIAAELVRERLTRGEASGYHFVFAELAGTVVAYACYGPIGCTVGSYDLYWIAVDPSAQNRGLGRRLAGEVERRAAAAGGRRLYAETSGLPRYESTRAFYRSVGYIAEAELPDFYAPGDAKVIFGKALPPPPDTREGATMRA